MEYRPAELARELGITSDTLYRSHIPAGAPARKDAKGNIWINGLLYKQWVESFQTPHRKTKPMKDNQGYCLNCKEVREIINPKLTRNKRGVVLAVSKCPVCNKRIGRYLKASKEYDREA